MQEKPKWRWWQFSLRTFLLVCLTLGVGLGWLGAVLRRLHEQRWIATQMASSGGDVYYDYQVQGNIVVPHTPPPGPAILRTVFGDDLFAHIEVIMWHRGPGPTERELALLKRLPTLRDVSLHGQGVTDDGLAHVASISRLRGVSLDDTKVTPDGLGQLAASSTLVSLTLFGSWVTDAHLKSLKKLPSLAHLQVLQASVTDDGMRHLGSLEGLHGLDVCRNPNVTDLGLRHLKSLPNLESLQLLQTGVTDDGLDVLRELPRLTGLQIAISGDQGAEHVAQLSNLRRLRIWGKSTNLGSSSLLKLGRLKKLEALELSLGSGVAPETLHELRQNLPQCRIVGADPSGKPFDCAPLQQFDLSQGEKR